MKFGLAVILCLLTNLLWAQPSTLQGQLASLQQRYHFPGATIAWSGPGNEEGALAVGLSDPQKMVPMTPNTPMLAASIGKSFVAAAIVSEVMRGKLDLDMPLAKYLGDRPWYRRLPNHDQLTLRHLLNHSGGLPDHVYQPGFALLFQQTQEEEGEVPEPEALVALILDNPALFPVGKGWAYSDTGYLLAAMVVESWLNSDWTELVQDRFLGPLRLDATIPSDHRRIHGLAVGMTSTENALGLPARTMDQNGNLLWHPGIEGAGGGLASTSQNLAKWGRLLWSGRTLGEKGTAQLLTGVPVKSSSPYPVYGLGVLIERSESLGEVRGHRGWIPGYVSSLRYYPEYDVAIAIQINSDVGMMGESGFFVQIESALTQELLRSIGKRSVSGP